MTPRCDRCNDSGTVALDVRNHRYVAPGPVPEDARGVCEYACRECPPAEEPEVDENHELTPAGWRAVCARAEERE